MNNQPCGQCRHYDVIRGPLRRATGMGRCAARSIYPTKEGPGQRFPAGVKRAAEGAMTKMEVVRDSEIVAACTLFEARE